MKTKWYIAAALMVLLAGSLWRFRKANHHQSASRAAATVARAERAIRPRPAPANPVRMTAIVAESAKPRTFVAPFQNSETSVSVMIDSQKDYQARFKAVQTLPAQLTPFEWTQVRAFLVKPGPGDGGQLEQVLKNELMDTLCAQSPPQEDLGDVLSAMYRDQNQNDVIRDYAVQHLAAYYEKASLQADMEKSLQSVRGTLWEAAADPKGSFGGTALLALNRLSQEYPAAFNQSEIAAGALRMAQNLATSELTHITAYQICAQLKVADALPAVIQAARTGETIPTRLSAIAALGVLGGEEQTPFLNEIMQDDQERLKPAARHALDLIRSHNNQANSRS